jgi:hypothetical protein
MSGGDIGDMSQLSPDTVIISSNENTLGPAQSALDAIVSSGPLANVTTNSALRTQLSRL